MKRLLSMLCLFAGIGALSASAAPGLFFTDLTSGPAGAIVTVYGSNLLPAVTVNGVSATIVASSSTKVSFIVPSTTSGSIVMSGSNALPFTIRAGHIYYVATNGSDSNAGSQSAPWATIPHAFNTAACGDVIYAMNGVSQTKLDNYGASLSVQHQCTQDQPLALVGYPGATVTIGSTALEYGIRNPDINGDGFNGFVFANLVVRGGNEATKVVGNQYWRFVGNDFSCPSGSGLSGCVELSSTSNLKFFGNSIHDTGAGGTKYYHSFYASTNSNHIEVGWNRIYNNKSCRGIQFYSTSGSPQFDLIVHDNIISGQQCDGINYSTVDAGQGPLEVYNNLVYHVGLGGATDGTPNEACFASLGYGTPGGQILVYGNTFADCGSAGGSTAGGISVLSGSPAVVLTSNLVAQNPGEVVYSPNTNQSLVASTNNVLLTQGTAGVVNASYEPVAGSPAIGAGMAYSGILSDLAGNLRPQSGKEDAGAYLYSTATAPSGPTATLSTTALSFGNQTVNTMSAAQSATLSNSGTSALAISKVAVSGTNASSFTLSHNCGTSLAAGQSCAMQVQFAPAATGSQTGAVTITDNASNPSQSLTLSGTGVSATSATVSVTPASLSFANQNVNTTSAAQSITVKNTGTAALSLTGLTLSGANSTAFKVTNGCGTSLAAAASCTIQVQFAPAAAGSLTASLLLASNASNSLPAISLIGTGVSTATASVSVTPASLTFASQNVNTTSAAQSITVKNTGTTALSLTGLTLSGANSTAFKVTNGCGTSLAAAASCAIQVQFAPAAAGSLTANLVLASNASNSTQTISLAGTAVNPTTGGANTTIHLSLNNLYFYNLAVNSTSAPQSIVVKNTGKAALTIRSLVMTGSQATSFLATSTCGSTVAVGASCTLSVSFAPKVKGVNSASLVLTYNGSPATVSIPFVGHGL